MKRAPSISIQILLAVLVTVITVLGISSGLELNVLQQRETKALQGQGALAVGRLANSLAYPLWDLNKKETERTVLEEFAVPDVLKICVFDEKGDLYVGKMREADGVVKTIDTPNGGGEALATSTVYSYSKPISFKETEIGRVTLEMNDVSLRAEQRKLRWGIAIRLFVLALLLSLVLFVALRVLVVRPLSTLKSWVEDIRLGNVTLPPRFNYSGDINSVTQAFGLMSVSLQKKNEELETEQARLQQLNLQMRVEIEQRKSTEEALRALEKRFSIAFNASPIPLTISSLEDGRFVAVNDRFLETHDFTREEVIGQTAVDLGLWPKADDRLSLTQRLESEGNVRDFEARMCSKSGEQRVFLISVEKTELDNKPCLLFATVDITERKEAERRANELTYYLSKMREAVIVSDLNYRFIFWNQGAEQLFGWSSAEAMGKTARELYQDDSMDELDPIRKAVADTGNWHGELRAVDRLGRTFFIDSSWTMVRNAAGEAEAIISIATDITERKEAEEALRASEERFTRIFNLSPYRMGIARIRDRVILAVNDRFLLDNGFTREAIIGHHLDRLKEFTDEQWWSQVLQLLEAPRPFRDRENRILTQSGEERFMLTSGEVIELDGELCFLWAANDITERKRAEDLVRISEEKFAKAFRSSPVGIAVTRLADNKYVEVNETLAKAIGFRRDELIGRSTVSFDLWENPGDRELFLTELAQNGTVRDFEASFRTRKGRVIIAQCSAELIEINGEQCVLSVLVDITDRKRAQEALKASEQKFSVAFNASPIWLTISATDGGLIVVNNRFLESTGFTRAEVIGRNALEIGLWSNPEDRSRLMQRVAQDGSARDVEVQLSMRNGEKRFFLLSVETIELEGIPCLLHAAIDITERKEAENALRASEERFADIFNLSPYRMGIIRISDGMILAVNECWVRDTGFSREEVVNHPIFEMEAWSDEARARMRRQLAEGKPTHQFEGQVRTKSGAERVTLTSTELIQIDGEPCFLWASNDITERKLAETALKTSEEQLRALSARMQSAREEEGTRIAREIHDELGSALTGLKWDLEKIDKKLAKPEDSALTEIRKQIVTMTNLIETTINTVRRISSELRPGMLDDLGLVAAIEWQAQQIQARTGIKYGWETELETVELSREGATAVFRIFQEVLTNVLRHSGADRFDVALRRLNGQLELTVKDNGRGITEGEKGNTLSLGLLGMKERALLVGGEVSIVGAKGEGTTVTVRVPATA